MYVIQMMAATVNQATSELATSAKSSDQSMSTAV